MIRPLRSAVALAAVLALAGACTPAKEAGSKAAAAAAAKVPYGANKAASGTFVHDGVTFYYEVYGEGEPLLLVHGNGGSLGMLAAQIDGFKGHRKVIAMDSRDQGRSGDSAGPITYEMMADDLAALVDHLKLGKVDVVGWSDGGIEALLMGVRHPDKVNKLVAMAANLNPDAIYPETAAWVAQMKAQTPPDLDKTPEGRRALKMLNLLENEPHIDPKLLSKVAAPTLVMSGDHDVIQLKHTIEIFESLPNANLAVLPNSTHAAPYDDPKLFNETVDRFLKTPFRKRDRIADLVASIQKSEAEMAK
ncbi:alpha/beta hydrolase [Phenylobacterium sp.]|uniref:alpha/beta fold hydrolase n=1 Tax=Phenylobacterium sp. TaxID=1871053 RepID=UPI0025EE1F02|nr:alpha/beta hydrolase [Phenylobacterium sp.]MBX3483841.1 alpha/beta hydrolase [Phenylobacterium sp.]MCW5761403.1 alpha/beta hydrolase [Phenylobacterium sp.]